MTTKELVLFSSSDGVVSLPVPMDGNTVWLSQKQMAELFGKDQSVISRHIKNAISEGEIDISSSYAKFAYPAENASGVREIDVYDLDTRCRSHSRCPYGHDCRISSGGEGDDGYSRDEFFGVMTLD